VKLGSVTGEGAYASVGRDALELDAERWRRHHDGTGGMVPATTTSREMAPTETLSRGTTPTETTAPVPSGAGVTASPASGPVAWRSRTR